MNTETIEIDGYKVTIAQDEGPENPFEAWDCEPPIITYYGGRHSYTKAYCDAPETMSEIIWMLPDSVFERGKRVELFRDFIGDKYSFREVIQETKIWGGVYYTSANGLREVFSSFITDIYGAKPEGWRDAKTWMEAAESLLKLAGIPCFYAQSNGYNQGDSTLVLVILTPEWLKKAGFDAVPDNAEEIMQSAVDLYSTWAWGDVYGISSITAPGPMDEDGDETEGEELEDGSVWGFYGSDHEKSGLLESARESVAYHKRKIAEESENLVAALCSAE